MYSRTEGRLPRKCCHCIDYGQFLPILFVIRGHNRCNDNIFGEVVLQFSNTSIPICGCLLGNQLNIDERTKLWTIVMASSCATSDTGSNVGNKVVIATIGLGDAET